MPEANEYNQQVGDRVTDWSPCAVPAPVTLDGHYVRVVPLSSAHFADLFAAVCGEHDGDLWTYRPIARPTSLPDLWMHLAAVVENPEWVSFALIPTEGESAGRASGIASYMRIEPTTGQVEVAGVLFAKSLRRTRAATEAIHLLMTYAFDDLGYRRFEWKCDSLNEPSRRAAARLGFVYEGTFRNHMITQGRNRDTAWFSVTDDEWPTVSAAHRAWLDTDNFDAGGRQRTRLSAATGPT